MNVQLKKFQASDAQDVAKYPDNQKIAKWLRDIFPHPYTLAAPSGMSTTAPLTVKPGSACAQLWWTVKS